MFNKIALIAAFTALTVGCGSKKSKSSPAVQPPVTQQPITQEPVTQTPTYDQTQNLSTQAVGLYQQSDNPNVYLRIDNQMNVETTLQLPVRVAGSDNRLTPTFPQILRTSGTNQLETLGYVNRGGNTFDNVTLRVTPINNGQILDVTMIVKLRQGDTVVSTSASSSALDELSGDEIVDGYGRRCRRGCNTGCGGGIGIGIGIGFPLPIPGMPGYPGAPYPGYPGGYPGSPGYPANPGDGGTYPVPPTTTPGTGTDTNCPNGTCVGEPLEDKEFVYRFIRIG